MVSQKDLCVWDLRVKQCFVDYALHNSYFVDEWKPSEENKGQTLFGQNQQSQLVRATRNTPSLDFPMHRQKCGEHNNNNTKFKCDPQEFVVWCYLSAKRICQCADSIASLGDGSVAFVDEAGSLRSQRRRLFGVADACGFRSRRAKSTLRQTCALAMDRLHARPNPYGNESCPSLTHIHF